MFLTSRRAAQAWLDAKPRGELVVAVAPSTTELLDESQCAVDLSAPGGTVALATALVAWWKKLGQPRWHVRYPTSDRGASSTEQAAAADLLVRVGPVDRRVVYETRTPENLTATLAAQVVAPWAVSFASPSAVDAFLANVAPGAPAPTHVLGFGNSTAAAWNARRPAEWPVARLTTTVIETIASLKEPS
jgi:uroporphyrinogen-III synthase